MISDRKRDHVNLTLTQPVEYLNTTGFDRVMFRHSALPELDFKDIDTSLTFLNKRLSFPLFISSMTGGYKDATPVNAMIAEFCETHQLAFGVGSQRAMLENPEHLASFSIARKKAPKTVICSNIGGVQLIGGLDKKSMNLLIDSIEADAILVHLNPLQELIQKEGDRNFQGVLEGIKKLVSEAPVPVLVKETGAGISGEVALRLVEVGVHGIDVAGVGGTSWAKVEDFRYENEKEKGPDFLMEWGMSTLQCLQEVAPLKERYSFILMASGGIRNAEHMLKSICLGADMSAMAAPILKTLHQSGLQGLDEEFSRWKDHFRKGMLLLGASRLDQLAEKKVYLV